MSSRSEKIVSLVLLASAEVVAASWAVVEVSAAASVAVEASWVAAVHTEAASAVVVAALAEALAALLEVPMVAHPLLPLPPTPSPTSLPLVVTRPKLSTSATYVQDGTVSIKRHR